MPDYVYIIREREFLDSCRNVYKIGKTQQDGLKRFEKYPKGSELILHSKCENCTVTEQKILSVFRSKYIARTDIGAEYFEGPVYDMLEDFYSILSSMIKLHHSSISSSSPMSTTVPMTQVPMSVSSNFLTNLEDNVVAIHPKSKKVNGTPASCPQVMTNLGMFQETPKTPKVTLKSGPKKSVASPVTDSPKMAPKRAPKAIQVVDEPVVTTRTMVTTTSITTTELISSVETTPKIKKTAAMKKHLGFFTIPLYDFSSSSTFEESVENKKLIAIKVDDTFTQMYGVSPEEIVTKLNDLKLPGVVASMQKVRLTLNKKQYNYPMAIHITKQGDSITLTS